MSSSTTTELLEKLAKQLGRQLTEAHLKLASAESCTAGALGFWLTSVPGSSAWYERGFITYSDASKIDMLGVKPATLSHFGAVSEQTAKEMAEGGLQKSSADMCIAITGIAGPGGGSLQKPVGTVWIAFAQQAVATHALLQVFPGDRQAIRLQVIRWVLEQLIAKI